jgi:hypothetical protein
MWECHRKASRVGNRGFKVLWGNQNYQEEQSYGG